MNNKIPIIIWIILIAGIILVTMKPKGPVPICCQVGPDSCAEGPAVTEEACLEMDGTSVPNTKCNLETGRCE